MSWKNRIFDQLASFDNIEVTDILEIYPDRHSITCVILNKNQSNYVFKHNLLKIISLMELHETDRLSFHEAAEIGAQIHSDTQSVLNTSLKEFNGLPESFPLESNYYFWTDSHSKNLGLNLFFMMPFSIPLSYYIEQYSCEYPFSESEIIKIGCILCTMLYKYQTELHMFPEISADSVSITEYDGDYICFLSDFPSAPYYSNDEDQIRLAFGNSVTEAESVYSIGMLLQALLGSNISEISPEFDQVLQKAKAALSPEGYHTLTELKNALTAIPISILFSMNTSILLEKTMNKKEYFSYIQKNRTPSLEFYFYLLYAKKNQPLFQTKLALCYLSGYGIAQNHELAIHWFQEAAKANYHPAEFFSVICRYSVLSPSTISGNLKALFQLFSENHIRSSEQEHREIVNFCSKLPDSCYRNLYYAYQNQMGIIQRKNDGDAYKILNSLIRSNTPVANVANYFLGNCCCSLQLNAVLCWYNRYYNSFKGFCSLKYVAMRIGDINYGTTIPDIADYFDDLSRNPAALPEGKIRAYNCLFKLYRENDNLLSFWKPMTEHYQLFLKSLNAPDDIYDMVLWIGNMIIIGQDYEQAASWYRKAYDNAADSSKKADASYLIAVCFQFLSHFDEAIRWYHQSLAWSEKDLTNNMTSIVRILHQLIMCYEKQENDLRAADCCQRLFELSDSNDIVSKMKYAEECADHLIHYQAYEKALIWLFHALDNTINPAFKKQLFFKIADCYSKMKPADCQKAIEYLHLANELSELPDEKAHISYYLGKYYYSAAGQSDDPENLYQEALKAYDYSCKHCTDHELKTIAALGSRKCLDALDAIHKLN